MTIHYWLAIEFSNEMSVQKKAKSISKLYYLKDIFKLPNSCMAAKYQLNKKFIYLISYASNSHGIMQS